MNRVAVIIPCFNEPIERLWPSIESAIHANADEVIVIDDGSAIPAMAPVGDVRLFRQAHAGIPTALNHGRARTSCELLCWLSCGDTMHPNKIRVQRGAMLDRGLDATFTSHSKDGVRVDPSDDWRERLHVDNQFCLGTMMLTSRTWDLAGGFDPELLWCQDWDFANRVATVAEWVHINDPLASIGEDRHTTKAQYGELIAKRQTLRARVAKRWRRK